MSRPAAAYSEKADEHFRRTQEAARKFRVAASQVAEQRPTFVGVIQAFEKKLPPRAFPVGDHTGHQILSPLEAR